MKLIILYKYTVNKAQQYNQLSQRKESGADACVLSKEPPVYL